MYLPCRWYPTWIKTAYKWPRGPEWRTWAWWKTAWHNWELSVQKMISQNLWKILKLIIFMRTWSDFSKIVILTFFDTKMKCHLHNQSPEVHLWGPPCSVNASNKWCWGLSQTYWFSLRDRLGSNCTFRCPSLTNIDSPTLQSAEKQLLIIGVLCQWFNEMLKSKFLDDEGGFVSL